MRLHCTGRDFAYALACLLAYLIALRCLGRNKYEYISQNGGGSVCDSFDCSLWIRRHACMYVVFAFRVNIIFLIEICVFGSCL